MNMKYLFPLGLLALASIGFVSCDKCDEVAEPVLEGYGSGNVVIDALEGDTIELKIAAENDYTTLWQLPGGSTKAGDLIVLGPVDETVAGNYTVTKESDKCIKETKFTINYVDLTPECDQELNVLSSRSKKDTFTYTSLKVTATEEANGVMAYNIKFGAQSSMEVKFNGVPTAGKYIFSGEAETDESEKNSVGMFFDFGVSNQYKALTQSEKFVFIRRANGVLKMAFCDIAASNTDREDEREMAMEIFLE